MHGVRLKVTQNLVFPHLASLSLSNVSVTGDSLNTFLTPSSMPKLSALPLHGMNASPPQFYSLTGLANNLQPLFSQLDFFQVRRVSHPSESSIFDLKLPVLLSEGLFNTGLHIERSIALSHNLHFSSQPYLLLDEHPTYLERARESTIARLQALSSVLSTNHETLVLPRYSYYFVRSHAEGGKVLQRLVEDCEARGIELVWEEGESREDDFSVSERFWSWVKEKKARSSA
jgi:hypothetical protein